MNTSRITGCILGTAVGDAMGLPYEGVSRRRAPKLLGRPNRYRFVLGRGMISDDTEHTCMVAQALISSGLDAEAFIRDFAKQLRWWLLTMPAGIGRATLRSIIKLWLGFGAENSGVFSAGNGPAMRSALFGVVFDDMALIVQFTRKSSQVTHSFGS